MIANIFNKKLNAKIAGFITTTILFSSFFPAFASPVNAQLFVPVWDSGNFSVNAVNAGNTTSLSLKELGFDGVAFMMLNLVIERMAASTVNWINRGFKGSPAFISNPEGYFADLGNKVAGEFIFVNPKINFLCSPISAKIKIALSQTHTGANRNWRCTLDDAVGNMEDFLGDFEKGGWDKFFRLTQESQNNPLGAYIQAEGELFQQIANKTDEKNKELSWGKGFFSWKDCAKWSDGVPGQMTDDFENITYDGEGNEVRTTVPAYRLADIPPKCLEERTNTPGSVVSEQLNKTLGLGGEKLAVADEINEIISDLLNQLVGQVVGGIGKGLRGLSSPDPVNDNRTFTEVLSNTTKDGAIDEYFDGSRQAMEEVVGLPNYNPYLCRDNPSLPECLPPNPPDNTSGTTGTGNRSSCDPTIENCEAQNSPAGSRGR